MLGIELALEELYWTHVEHFPMHCNSISNANTEELVTVLSHGIAGMSSSVIMETIT